MATPHMMAGAIIGRGLRRPWLAWPAAFASHFFLDFAPHLDSHALFGAESGGPTFLEAAIAIPDFILGALLIGWLVWREADRRVVLGGALFAILIDLIEDVLPLGPWFEAWPATAWLSQFHHSIQHNVTPAQWQLGVGTQVVVVAVALWLFLPRRPRKSRLSAQNNS